MVSNQRAKNSRLTNSITKQVIELKTALLINTKTKKSLYLHLQT